jgi:hypothetical protein
MFHPRPFRRTTPAKQTIVYYHFFNRKSRPKAQIKQYCTNITKETRITQLNTQYIALAFSVLSHLRLPARQLSSCWKPESEKRNKQSPAPNWDDNSKL